MQVLKKLGREAHHHFTIPSYRLACTKYRSHSQDKLVWSMVNILQNVVFVWLHDYNFTIFYMSVFILAAGNGQVEVLKWLIENGADCKSIFIVLWQVW